MVKPLHTRNPFNEVIKMKILRKVNENEMLIYHIKTNLGLIIKVKTHANLSNEEVAQTLTNISNDMDEKLKSNIE